MERNFDIENFIDYVESLVKFYNVKSSTDKFNAIKRRRKINQVLYTSEDDHNVFCQLVHFLSENIDNFSLYDTEYADLPEDVIL